MTKTKKHKLGVIVPYRNRYRQLIHFKKAISEYLEDRGIDYAVVIVEQDDATAFNRGKLLNIGVLRAKELNCDYVVFHDVDMIPQDVDYSYSKVPLHLIGEFTTPNGKITIPFDQYFGGVTLFPVSKFEEINGYSNDYWGWGFEDDDLFHRVKKAGLQTELIKEPNYTSSTTSLKFNGVDSYVEAENVINYKRSFTIHISFLFEDLKINHESATDRYPIFTVPGYDFTLYYDSFKRYNVEIFDRRGNIHIITSDITEIKHTKATILYNHRSKTLSLYLDKILIGTVVMEEPLYNYGQYKTINIGCGNRIEGAFHKLSYFKGGIDCFAIYSKAISRKDIHSLVDNNTIGLGSNFNEYESADNLSLYYDPKFIRHYKLIDITSNDHTGTIYNCWVDSTDFTEYKYRAIPVRRSGKFKLLDHEPGGYLNGRWKDQLTRYNQLKFTNEVLTGQRSLNDDGLTTCEYVVHGETKNDNIYQMIVGI